MKKELVSQLWKKPSEFWTRNLRSNFLGLSLIVQGIMTININLFVLPILDRKIGPVRTNQIGSAAVAIVSSSLNDIWHVSLTNFSELLHYSGCECLRWNTSDIVDRVVAHDGRAHVRQHIGFHEHICYGTERGELPKRALINLHIVIDHEFGD